MADFAGNGNPPDFIWFGDWTGNTHTSVVTNNCIAATHWVNNQRHKQYAGGHNETWNGVTINIDSDCSNGPVYYPIQSVQFGLRLPVISSKPQVLGEGAKVRAGLFLATLVILGGCVAAAPPGSAAPPTPVPSPFASSSRPLTNVRLARAGPHVVILANGKAFLESGASLNIAGQSPPSAPTSEAITSSSSANLVYVAARDSHSVIAFASADGGTSWSAAGQQEIAGMDAIGDVRVAEIGDHFAVLVGEATSTAVSSGVVATAALTGGAWKVSPAPVGGNISSAGGHFWITGGVMGDQVFASTDGTAWGSVKVPASSTYWTAATATDVDGIGVVIPVTSHDPAGPSEVTFFATSDFGKTWQSLTSVTAPLTEFNTTIPTSITPDGRWVAIWPDGSKVLVGSLDAKDNQIMSPNGLPANVYEVMFSSATTGVAASSVATCPDGKSSCTSTTVVTRTDDGGQNWVPVP